MLIAFDTETYLIQPTDKAPKPVCCTWADESRVWITTPEDPETLRLWSDPNNVFVGQNIAYDIIVMMRWHPRLIPAMVRALDESRVFDTSMRERLLHLGQVGSKGYEKFPSLESLASKYLGLDLSKDKHGDDIWRLKYGTLDGVPFDQWPAEALRYALSDARHTFDVFRAQGSVQYALPTEAAQVRAAVVLNAIGTWGFSVNQTKRQQIEKSLRAKVETLSARIQEKGWVGKGSQAKLQDLVKQAWSYKQRQTLAKIAPMSGINFHEGEFFAAVGNSCAVTYLTEALKNLAPLPGITSLSGTDVGGWLRAMIKKNTLLPMPMTTEGVSIAGETLEALSDIVPEFNDYVELRHLEKMLKNYVEPYANDTVHPRFVPLVSTGRTGCGTPNCFSDDTEILTDSGWRSFGSLTSIYISGGLSQLPRLAQWDSGNISFVRAEAWTYHISTDMVNLRNKHTDLFVTADHRCLLISDAGKASVVSAKDYTIYQYRKQLGAGLYSNEHDNTDYSDGYLRLCVAVQADAHWHDNGWSFSFRKKRKQEQLLRIASSLGLHKDQYGCTESVDSGGARYRFRVYSGALAERIKAELGTSPKLLPESWIHSLSRRQQKVLCDESFLWDGLSTRLNNYSCSVEHNCDVMQALFILTGKRTNKRIYYSRPGANPNYQCDITNRNYSWTANTESVLYSTPIPVSCCSVPSGFVVVRRNGKVSITGQCQNIPRKDKTRPDEAFRTMFQARPGRKLGTVDYSQLELCTLAATIRAMFPGVACALGDAIDEGKDVHCVTGGLIAGRTYEQMVAGKKAKDPEVENLRQSAKAVNFGKPGGLGMGAFIGYAKANYGLTLDRAAAFKIIQAWEKAWPEIPGRYLAYSASQTESSPDGTFTAYTITGRPKARCSYTEGSNYPFQGLAADGAKAALWAIWREAVLGWFHRNLGGDTYGAECGDSPLRESRLVNFVHDEIVAEHPDNDLGAAAMKRQTQVMIDTMRATCQNLITIRAEGQLSDAWEH